MSGSDVRHCGLAQSRFSVRKSKRPAGSTLGFQNWPIKHPRKSWRKMPIQTRSRGCSRPNRVRRFYLITVFRLFSPWRDPWDATGAFIRGGRWNSPGTAVLYSASSLSLGCLEILVHIRNANNFPDYAYSQLAIPEQQIEEWESTTASRSPERRRAIFDSEVLAREEGDIWIHNRRALRQHSYRRPGTPEFKVPPWILTHPVRQVPSAVIPQEWNYLIDPDDETLRSGWSVPRPFRIDPRLLDPRIR